MMYGQPYYDPSIQQAYNERMMQLQQQYPQFFNQQMQAQQQQPNQQMQPQQGAPVAQAAAQRQSEILPGRAVTSIDEVRAIAADPMGGMGVYTDVGNKMIHTKQINNDGLAVLKTYVLDETPPPAPPEPKEYVEKAEVSTLFDQIKFLTDEVKTLKGALSNATANASSDKNVKGSTKSNANVPAADGNAK